MDLDIMEPVTKSPRSDSTSQKKESVVELEDEDRLNFLPDHLTQHVLSFMTIEDITQDGRSVAFPGDPLGSGLTPTATKELGLVPEILVGTSLIDAHAGGIGVMESVPESDSESKDPKSKGVIYGLTLDTSEKQLALLYLAVQGIAYGTRHVVEHCNAHGHKIGTLLACGGLAKNPLYVQELADILGCPIILPRESEAVHLGAAILGAVGAKKYSSLKEAMKALNAAGQVIHPSKDPKVKQYHDAKYRIFRYLYEQQLSQRSIMAQALS